MLLTFSEAHMPQYRPKQLQYISQLLYKQITSSCHPNYNPFMKMWNIVDSQNIASSDGTRAPLKLTQKPVSVINTRTTKTRKQITTEK